MMRWWVERGVDGFRMDVINLISKPTGELVDGEVPPGKRYASGFHIVANGPRLDEFLAEMNAAVGLSAQQPADGRRDAGLHHRGRPAGHRPGAT